MARAAFFLAALLLAPPDLRASGVVLGDVAEFGAGAVASLAAHEAGHWMVGSQIADHVSFHAPNRVLFTATVPPSRRQLVAFYGGGFAAQMLAGEALADLVDDAASNWFVTGFFWHSLLAAALYREPAPYDDYANIARQSGLRRWQVRALVTAKFAVDLWRLFHPRQRWSLWLSRSTTAAAVVGVAYSATW